MHTHRKHGRQASGSCMCSSFFHSYSVLLQYIEVLNCTLKDMQVSNPNNVKIYNLSAGKSLPEVGQNISDVAITGDFQKCNVFPR